MEVAWRILRNACYTDSLPQDVGEALSWDFWPNWNSEGTANSNRIEPDVFLRFAALDLIVESKRWDNCMQSREQWEREVTAYVNEYGTGHGQVRLLALGGIWKTDDDEVIVERRSPTGERKLKCPVHMCKWNRLLNECQRAKRELSRMKYHSSQTLAHQRILSDLIDLFTWHGFQAGVWFSDIVPRLPHINSSVFVSHRVFQGLSSKHMFKS